ncbi:MAG: amidohydrolase [Bacteroidetes bacterium]|nr:amidohydrolase [Bacteroidota bacterium]
MRFIIPALLLLAACTTKQKEVDLLVHNATIYTVDSLWSVQEAMAVSDGKIVEIGGNEEILKKYNSKNIHDAAGKFIFPGFIDAHCHFYGYGKGLNEINLVATKSFKEIVERTTEYCSERDVQKEIIQSPGKNGRTWIIGRGWDQNDWVIKEYPDRRELDSLFPNIPVILKRIDGHAVLVNGAALEIAGFTEKTRIKGGELIIKNGKLSGVLVDNAADSLEKSILKPGKELIKKALLKAQANCLAMGLTTIDDAGLEKAVIDMMDELHKSSELKMRIYAMLTPNAENLNYYLKNGKYKTERLNVRSFKFYGDGALGSRGACLLKDYSDKTGWKGFLLNDITYFEKNAALMLKNNFQMNTHCIGDSATRIILNIISRLPEKITKARWRIEHAQIVNEKDISSFKKYKIVPSVQPTHATSDMYWADKRLGNERIKSAYCYKTLLNAAGVVALGTDFPVEDISPFKTFYAAVFRKDAEGFPKEGFQMENALTREETIKGMTIWAAYSNFEEKEKGSLEKGKWADFIILDTDLMKCSENKVLNTKVLSTFISGEEVYKKK